MSEGLTLSFQPSPQSGEAEKLEEAGTTGEETLLPHSSAT